MARREADVTYSLSMVIASSCQNLVTLNTISSVLGYKRHAYQGIDSLQSSESETIGSTAPIFHSYSKPNKK